MENAKMPTIQFNAGMLNSLSLSKLQALSGHLLLWTAIFGVLTGLLGLAMWRVSVRISALQAEEKLKSAHKIAEIQRDNLTLQLKVEEERTARLKIEERFSPRTISDEQTTALRQNIAELKGHKLTVTATAGNAEAFDFAEQLTKVLSDAGLEVSTGVSRHMSYTVSGFQLVVGRSRTKDAETIQKALNESKLAEGFIPREPSSEPTLLELFVGPKQ